MAWESSRDFPLEEIVGGTSGFTETGYLVVVKEDDRPGLQHNCAMQLGLGIDTMVVTAEDLLDIAPMVSVSEDEAMGWEPQSGYADPYLVTSSYANAAIGMGAEINLGVKSSGIDVSDGRVRAVNTPQGRIETPAVVIAAGPWSKAELARVGVDVPLVTVRHQVASCQASDNPLHPAVEDIAQVFLLQTR